MILKHWLRFKICYELHCFVNQFYYDPIEHKEKRPFLRRLNNFLASLWLKDYLK